VRFLDLALGLIALLGVVVIAAVLAGGRPYLAAGGILLIVAAMLVAYRTKRLRASRAARRLPDRSA